MGTRPMLKFVSLADTICAKASSPGCLDAQPTPVRKSRARTTIRAGVRFIAVASPRLFPEDDVDVASYCLFRRHSLAIDVSDHENP